MMIRHGRAAFTLIELGVVVLILALLVGLLLPALSSARKASLASKLARSGEAYTAAVPQVDALASRQQSIPAASALPAARIKSFVADIALTPRLSVGTVDPESIYESKFTATLEAAPATGDGGESRIELPLPPQVISLADLSVTVNGEPSDAVAFRDGKLIWHGPLAGASNTLKFTYSAVGKGLYALDVPTESILDKFNVSLAAHGSDVQMMELSLQPTRLTRADGVTTYVWDYSRLMVGQPIRMDILGIAPIDRLGELSWLGPLSIVMFGLVIGLMARAFALQRIDRWMLLLFLGTFTGAYPLMYFAQEFVSLTTACAAAAAVVLLVIAVRAVTLVGLRLGVIGLTLPAALIMTLTLWATVQINLQGIILTGEVLGLFVLAMTLIARLSPAGLLPVRHAAQPAT